MNSQIDVLDHGYVKLLNLMGSDDEIAQNARVSTHYSRAKRKNERLIWYLMRNRHTSPFELAVLKFEIKLPIFVERQMVRHRTASMNEQSGRMSELEGEFYIPEPEVIGQADPTNKQARDPSAAQDEAEFFRAVLRTQCGAAHEEYRLALEKGIPREVARLILPVNVYTKKVWQMGLHNLLHFLDLRLAGDAQWEIRQYAMAIEEFVAEHFPVTHEAWRKRREENGR